MIVSGDPGSGKSTLARQCSSSFGFPVISRDSIKESLFDALGWSDREWSRKVGSASFEVMFQFVETMMKAGASFILDCHFSSPKARQRIADLVHGYPHRLVEVTCTGSPDILFYRFQARASSGFRHPGHADHQNLEEFRERLGRHPVSPLVPVATHLVIDTGLVGPEEVFKKVSDLITEASQD